MNDSIDKETFLAGMECLTKGWFVHHRLAEAPTEGLQWRFHAGSEVARLARAWLGAGRMLRRTPREAALTATARALSEPDTTLLFEASFRTGECMARADAVRRAKTGWDLLEIKSGLAPRPDDPIKPEYIDDIAYTVFVARAAGLPIELAKLILLNRDYRLDGEEPLFVECDVTEQAFARADDFRKHSIEVVRSIMSAERPPPTFQFVCKNCDFFETDCLGAGIDDPLFAIPRLSLKKFQQLRNCQRISQLPASVELTDNQRRVCEVIRSGTPFIDLSVLNRLDAVCFPILFLDFETVNPLIPWFPGCPPYEIIPFQYSLHIRPTEGASPEHRSYLASQSGDWRRDLTVRLLDDLGSSGTIIVYSNFEQSRLKALAERFNDLADRINGVIARLLDLEAVVREGYVHPGFGGRTSIKVVLPVVAPELSYGALRIANGDDAAATFALMRVGEIPECDHIRERQCLDEYCRQDTLALLRIFDRLQELRTQSG